MSRYSARYSVRYCLAIAHATASLVVRRSVTRRHAKRVEGRGQRVEGIDKRTNSSKHASLSYLSREAVTVHAR